MCEQVSNDQWMEANAMRQSSKLIAWALAAFAVAAVAVLPLSAQPGGQVDRDQGLVIRIDVTRWVLSHGRVDSIRSVGINTPENPRGRPVDGITPRPPQPPVPPGTPPPPVPPGAPPSILDVIAAQPDPLRIDMDLDPDGTTARNPRQPSALVTAGANIPSGFTLVVAQLRLNGDNSIDTYWRALVPRFGNGNYYATVSIRARPSPAARSCSPGSTSSSTPPTRSSTRPPTSAT